MIIDCELVFDFVLDSITTASTISVNINSIPMLNGTNFKNWKKNVMIIFGCVDLDLALREERLASLNENSSIDEKARMKKWDRSNCMSLMIMKRSIPKIFRSSMSEEKNAKTFIEEIKQRFAKNEKIETSIYSAKLVSMEYNGKGNIREYIMEMSYIAFKLKALKLQLSEDLLVHLVFISLPAQYSQFKMSYNTQKDKWTFNELISHCVQENERLKHEGFESVISKDKKRKRGKEVFEGVQDLIADELISAGHDISDGGLLACALEMAFAGNCGITLKLNSEGRGLFQTLFAEELGLVLEVSKSNLDHVLEKLHGAGVSAEIIGQVTDSPSIGLKIDGIRHLNEKTFALRDMWEETSFELEKLQRLASCVDLEKEGLKSRQEPSWALSFTPSFTDENYMTVTSKPKVAVIREENSNGDSEMSAAFYVAGFEPWDVSSRALLFDVAIPLVSEELVGGQERP